LKVKLTPLNIVSAMGLVAGVWFLADKNETQRPGHIDMTGWVIGFCFLIFMVAFVSDLIFRKFIPELKKIWIVEGVLIIFTIILMFILKLV
jgi:hypothetical protein